MAMTATLKSRVLLSILLSLSALLRHSSAQLKVYAETELKLEPGVDRQPSSFVIIICNVEAANATVPTRWVLPHGQIISRTVDRYQIGQGFNENGLWSTLLAVQNVSYKDAGYYTCEVAPSGVPRSQCECVDFPFSATTKLQLEVNLVALEEVIVGAEDTTKSVQLGCEMTGYLRPDEDLAWYKGNYLLPLKGATYSVIFMEGTPGAGQNGENGTVHGRLSMLNINHPTVADSGVYRCKIRGTNTEATMSLAITKTSIKDPVTRHPNSQSTDGDVIAIMTEFPLRGNKPDGKSGKDLLGGGNSNSSGRDPSCSIGVGEVATIVVITCVLTAALSGLLTLAVTCFCLKRAGLQPNQSKNGSELVPSVGDDGLEIGSSNSIIFTTSYTSASKGAGMVKNTST